VPRVTAVTPARTGGYVEVELDGVAWRRIPLEVAVRAALTTELELGRAELRDLRRELRRAEAIETAASALRHRDRSRAGLRARLTASGVAPSAREEALDALERAGVVNDLRFARSRAEALAARGSGDELIRADLAEAGVGEADVTVALGELEPERERAVRVVCARGASPATARWLARRGFGEDAIEASLPSLVADEQ
jgi:SOS response regulatory protein OraA/RecX